MKKNRRMKGVEMKTKHVSVKSREKLEALQRSLVIEAPLKTGMSCGLASIEFRFDQRNLIAAKLALGAQGDL